MRPVSRARREDSYGRQDQRASRGHLGHHRLRCDPGRHPGAGQEARPEGGGRDGEGQRDALRRALMDEDRTERRFV